ncbi:hypothetical protein QBC40DRAFT_348854 [Triangularia verruculosa]|uniref:Uncharacterized protein n=1 Tax=Triangularia verruculosa TaxID=2587418 RepID=A0AAN7AWM0_9PEZI|nr:hypothetical protein QBC40DRAFT_348854 [Triangularia verruculosa]
MTEVSTSNMLEPGTSNISGVETTNNSEVETRKAPAPSSHTEGPQMASGNLLQTGETSTRALNSSTTPAGSPKNTPSQASNPLTAARVMEMLETLSLERRTEILTNAALSHRPTAKSIVNDYNFRRRSFLSQMRKVDKIFADCRDHDENLIYAPRFISQIKDCLDRIIDAITPESSMEEKYDAVETMVKIQKPILDADYGRARELRRSEDEPEDGDSECDYSEYSLGDHFRRDFENIVELGRKMLRLVRKFTDEELKLLEKARDGRLAEGILQLHHCEMRAFGRLFMEEFPFHVVLEIITKGHAAWPESSDTKFQRVVEMAKETDLCDWSDDEGSDFSDEWSDESDFDEIALLFDENWFFERIGFEASVEMIEKRLEGLVFSATSNPTIPKFYGSFGGVCRLLEHVFQFENNFGRELSLQPDVVSNMAKKLLSMVHELPEESFREIRSCWGDVIEKDLDCEDPWEDSPHTLVKGLIVLAGLACSYFGDENRWNPIKLAVNFLRDGHGPETGETVCIHCGVKREDCVDN